MPSQKYKYPFFRHSLRAKLLWPVLTVLLLVMGSTMALNFWLQLKHEQKKAGETFSLVADAYEEEIQSWFVRREREVNLTAYNPLVRDAVSEIVFNGSNAVQSRQIATRYLQEMCRTFPFYDEILCVDPQGRVLVSTRPERVGENRVVDDAVTKPLEQGIVYFQDAYFAYSTKVPSVVFSVPVLSGAGEWVAVMIFRVGTSKILDAVARAQAQLDSTGEVVLLRQDRLVITELRRSPGSALNYRLNIVPAQRAVQGEEGVMKASDYTGHMVLAAYRFIPYSGWGLLIKKDFNEIMIPVWRAALLMILPGFAGLILLVVLVTGSVGRAIAPLEALTRAAGALARGELDRRVTVSDEQDEMSLLGRTFNQMADGLQAQFMAQDKLQQLLKVLVSTINLKPLIDSALEAMVRNYGFTLGAIYVHSEENEGVLRRVAAYCGGASLLEREEISAAVGPVGQALISKQPVLLEDIPPDTVYTLQTITGDLLPRSLIHLPLLFKEESQGVLVLGSLDPLEPGVLEQLQTATTMLGVAVHNARLFERVNILSEHLSRLNEELAAQNEELQVQAEELQSQAEELQVQSRELQAQRIELTEKNRQLEQATRAKSEFLAKMSHELRTPLNAVIGFSEILLEGLFGNLNDKQQEYVGDILASGRHLLALINDILDLSKIEVGRMELMLAFVDPAQPLDEALKLLVPEAQRKQLFIHNDIVSGQYTVRADAERLKQIFVNLLSNAVKFTPAEGRISVGATRKNGELKIWVTDTGIGIAPELREVIFEEFRQGNGAATRRYQGTGLGLDITKKLVEMHGGRIWVDSRPGERATFTFTLPLARDGGLVAHVHDALNPPAAAARERVVLLVEDDPAAVKLISGYLAGEGYDLVVAGSGEEGLAKARELRLWVIILDVMLPGKDGWEVLSELKSSPATREIPVLVVSSLNEAGRGLSLGAVDYFVKPVDKDLLLNRLRSLDLNREDGLPTILVVDDDPQVVEYLTVVLQSNGYKVSQAFGGKEAIQLAIKEKPDVLILDLVMPEVTGFDVVEELSRHPGTGRIRFFILTAKDLTAAERERLSRRVMAIARKGELSKEQFLEQLLRVRSLLG